MNPQVRDTYFEQFRQIEKTLPGRNLPWLNRLRSNGLEKFMQTGFPSQALEEWKYTDVRPIEKRAFTLAQPGPHIEPEALHPFLFEDLSGHRIVFVDGRFAAHLSALSDLPDNVIVSSLSAALEAYPDKLEPYLERIALDDANGFLALNSAFINNGAYIHMERGVVLDGPLHLLFISTGENDVQTHMRNIIIAEENSDAVIMEDYVSLQPGQHFTNTVTQIYANNNAVIEHYKLERESEKAYHISNTQIHQARDSRYTSHNFTTGGRLVRNDLYSALDAEGTECMLNGLYYTRGRQHVDNHTHIAHIKPHGTSKEWYKGILDGHSRGIFDGRIVVHKDAQHTDAQQANNNLLLSEHAEADSKPQLEIYADDVKCAHGSTVGQLDEDALFYLRSRAIDPQFARSLLVYAFAGDILSRIKLRPIRAHLENILAHRLLENQSIEGLV